MPLSSEDGKPQRRTHLKRHGGENRHTLSTSTPIETHLFPPLKTKLHPVNRSRPCPVCGGNHKCSHGTDGLIVCGRRSGPQPGFVCLGTARGDSQFTLFRSENDPVIRDRERPQPPAAPPRPPVDWPHLAEKYRRNLTVALADELCCQLRLPRVALDSLPAIGYDGSAWTFPEQDGDGRTIGIVRRFRDGSKKAMPGSRRGLTVPVRWRERDTPLFVVEGQSDTLALSLCAVSAIGRPSNCGAVDMLAVLLSDFPPDRPIVVLGENDQKPGGSWPGKDGAITVARQLAERLSRPVHWTLPPDSSKDIREWILTQNPIPKVLDSFHEIGDKLCQF